MRSSSTFTPEALSLSLKVQDSERIGFWVTWDQVEMKKLNNKLAFIPWKNSTFTDIIIMS